MISDFRETNKPLPPRSKGSSSDKRNDDSVVFAYVSKGAFEDRSTVKDFVSNSFLKAVSAQQPQPAASPTNISQIREKTFILMECVLIWTTNDTVRFLWKEFLNRAEQEETFKRWTHLFTKFESNCYMHLNRRATSMCSKWFQVFFVFQNSFSRDQVNEIFLYFKMFNIWFANCERLYACMQRLKLKANF